MFFEKIKEIANESKYTKWYISIIQNAQNRTSEFKTAKQKKYIATSLVGNVDLHHILPRSISEESSKNKDNLVFLSYREHFICHLLLVKMLSGKNKSKMYAALNRIRSKHKINSATFSLLKEEMSKNNSIRQKQYFEANPEEKEKFIRVGLDALKIIRDANPKEWVERSMGSEEARAKCKETHQSDSHRAYCRQRELLKGAEELIRLAKLRHQAGVQKGIEKYGSEEAFRNAHAAKIRGRVKIINLETLKIKVVREPDFNNEFFGWVLLKTFNENNRL